SYRRFVEGEQAPLYEGSVLEDLATLPLANWRRRGGKIAYTCLGNQENINLQVVEIPPQGELKPEHHIYEAVMYVLQGRGATTIWQEGEAKQTVEWEKNALLAIPLNAWHQEFNSSGDQPCRVVFGTNMAHILNLYHNSEFVFSNSFVFNDRYSSSWQRYFTDAGSPLNLRLFETNFIPDIGKFALDPYPERGRRMSVMRLCMASASLSLHIAEVSAGTYMTAHKHGPGAHVLCVAGEGYELLFMPGEDPKRKLPLKPTAVVSPQRNEYHQHFNTGHGPLRMLAFKEQGYSSKYATGKSYQPALSAEDRDPNAEIYQISYEREDPRISEEYYRELERKGIALRLPPLNQGGG
ncbi:MAG TPA: cupin domain-containing protein, partial [Terriglobales bacterium]|nr:cupin domain-containing protein [Terriglobales bacterium]